MLGGFKFKIRPNNKQKILLNREFGCQRFVWNYFLDLNIKKYETDKKFIFYNEMSKLLTNLKVEFKFLKMANSQSLQQTLKDLDQALKNCFKSKFGFPKFKRKFDKQSFRVPQHFSVLKGSIKIPKIGILHTIFHRKIKGITKFITIRKENGCYYASLCIDFRTQALPITNKQIGLDLGVKHFATTSDGHFQNSFLQVINVKKLINKIKFTQRKFKNKTKLSKNWLKVKNQLFKLHIKLKNKRQDFLHKFSTELVRNYDLIVIEDLKVKNMTKSASGTAKQPGKNVKQKSGLNRNILNQGWSMFTDMLQYKTIWYGKQLIKVDPKYTSQTCSNCQHIDKNSRISQSNFVCTNCNHQINADLNASINILNKGLI